MSCTNRGAERSDLDFYQTPVWLVESFMPILQKYAPVRKCLRILEPACRGDRIVNGLKKTFPDDAIYGWDIANNPSIDYLAQDPKCIEGFDIIVTNPPYKYALEFIKQSMCFMRDYESVVAMLLRVNFLGSKKRAKWLRTHLPHIHVTPKRPSFVGGRSDGTEYAWFVWKRPYEQTSGITIMHTEHIK